MLRAVPSSRRPSWRAALALAAVLALTSACTNGSGDDDSARTGTTTSATATPRPSLTGLDDRVEALQEALSGEHDAVQGVGLAAGPLRGAELAAARESLVVHRTRRDELSRLIDLAGATPVDAPATVTLPPGARAANGVPRTAAEARAVLAEIERSLAVTYDLLATAEDPQTRTFAAEAAAESTARRAELLRAPTP
jgi:hypothetical protein